MSGEVRYGPGQDRERERMLGNVNAWADLAATLGEHDPGIPLSCVRPRSEAHRATDWRIVAEGNEEPNPWTCGLCHPPGRDDIERAADLLPTAPA